MLVLLIGVTALSATAKTSIQGTIGWAHRCQREVEVGREELLRATQVDLQAAIYDRERLNTQLQTLNKDLDIARRAAETAYRSKGQLHGHYVARAAHPA